MSREKGSIAEDKAALYLEENGFMILQRNYYSRFGEIDIIATKEDVIHFVEVKSAEDYETAIYNITPSKLQKVIKTAYTYIKKHALEKDFMIDAFVVTPDQMVLVENITL